MGAKASLKRIWILRIALFVAGAAAQSAQPTEATAPAPQTPQAQPSQAASTSATTSAPSGAAAGQPSSTDAGTSDEDPIPRIRTRTDEVNVVFKVNDKQ